jgi:3-hydroxybutyryl-CoA dehydratase
MPKFDEYQIGQKASLTKTYTETDVRQFAELTLDVNPVHLDAAYAENTIFKQRIVHGFFYGALISAVLGTQLPGYGTIYMGQQMSFLKPVYLGDTITAEVEITEMVHDKKIMKLKTTCTKADGTVVLTGEATIKRLE